MPRPLTLSGYFSDPDGDTLSYKASSSPSGVVTVSVSTATLTITPLAAGAATVIIMANDGHVNASLPISVSVVQSNRAPVATGTIPSVTVKVGGSAAVYVEDSFSDPDGDTLTYTASSSNMDKATVSVTGSTVLVAPVKAGTATITVTATDPGGLTATQIFSVTVSEPNRAPVAVGAIQIPRLNVGQGLSGISMAVEGYFSDPDGDRLTYTASSSDTGRSDFYLVQHINKHPRGRQGNSDDNCHRYGPRRFERYAEHIRCGEYEVEPGACGSGHDSSANVEPRRERRHS